MTSAPDTGWTLGWTRNSNSNKPRKTTKALCRQSLLAPIYLKENLIVELALMHKYGIITVLPSFMYASPIFAQRKPNRKLSLLVDLRKINSLIADDYTNNNHPVSTLSDAAQHLAGKSLFGKLDCSQAYHCFQMANQRSVEMLAFNFASRTFAHKDLRKVLADLCLPFEVSCASTWTWSSKLTNGLNTLTVLELQPITLRTSTGTSEQISSAFTKQDWNWKLRIATLELDKLYS